MPTLCFCDPSSNEDIDKKQNCLIQMGPYSRPVCPSAGLPQKSPR